MAKQAKLTLLIDLADKLTSKLGAVESRLTKFQSKWQSKLNNITDNFANKIGMSGENLKRGLTVGAMAGVTALGVLSTKSVQAAEKFDSAFLPIKQLNLDKSANELNDYKNQIRDASFEIGMSIEQGTNAIYDLQSATGTYGKDAIDIYKKVGKYSIATGADVNDAMNSTTKAMKAFGLSVADIDDLLESNAKTVQTGITTFNELAKVQTEYAGAAASAGQGVDTANKVFAMFTSIAKNSDVGANMAKTFFQGLGQQADKFESVLKIKVFDDKGSMRQADEILKDISGKFKNMSDQQITQAINAIGGPEGLRGALDKVKTGAEDMISTFDAFDSSAFSMEAAIKNAEGDFATMKKVFFDRIEILMTKFGEKIMPMIANIFDILTPALNFLYKNIDWLLPVMGTFIGLLGLATAAVWLLNSALFANPIVWVIALVGGLIALIVVAIKKFNDWGAAVLALFGPFGMLISFIKNLYDQWESVKKAFTDGGIIGALKRIGLILLDTLLEPIQQLLELLSNIPGLGSLAKKGANVIDAMRWKMGTHEPLKIKIPDLPNAQSKQENATNLYSNGTSNSGSDTKKGKNDKVKDVVNSLTGDAKASRNITVNLEALHKGNINMNGNESKGMSMQELESWFNEMMLRVIRSAELS